jgi:membrane protease YdiL (CAAX protease family)
MKYFILAIKNNSRMKTQHLKTLFALTIIVFIPFGLMIWMRNHQSTGFASIELIAYPLVFGGGSIIILYFLKKYFLKEQLKEFNSGEGKWKNDILHGIILTIIYFILYFVERPLFSNILSFSPNMELLGLMLDMRQNPILLILWFGPVLWIGISLYEELIRIFILNSLWKFSSNIVWSVTVIALSGIIIGLAHWSQGSYGMITIGIKSLVSGFFFFKYKRLMPLVYAHVLYDGMQVAMLLITYQV